MKEFWIYRNDYSSIETAERIEDLHLRDVVSIEEHELHSFEHNHIKVLSKEESDYYEQFFEDYDEKEHINKHYQLDKKVSSVLKSKVSLNTWEKKFIYGLKRSITNNYNISKKQENFLNTIVNKYNIQS